MLNLPETTTIYKTIPKASFCRQANFGGKLDQLLTDQIAKIILVHTIKPNTINVAVKTWPEINIFNIQLKSGIVDIDQDLLATMDKCIPRPTVFVISSGEHQKIIIGYKQKNPQTKRIEIQKYFHTPWRQNHVLEIQGNDIDTIYANFIKQINQQSDTSELVSLSQVKKIVQNEIQDEKLDAQIQKLTKAYNNEYLASKRNDIARQIHALKLQKSCYNQKNSINMVV